MAIHTACEHVWLMYGGVWVYILLYGPHTAAKAIQQIYTHTADIQQTRAHFRTMYLVKPCVMASKEAIVSWLKHLGRCRPWERKLTVGVVVFNVV